MSNSRPQPPRSAKRTLLPKGFDFSRHMGRVCADATARVADLSHIDMSRVAVTFSQARRRVLHGLQAKLTPLRFQGGERHQVRNGRRWTIEPVYDPHGREMLYILSFYLPRFLDQPREEKLVTIFHELLHISPEFDGDLRRFPGRCYAHSRSQAEFDNWAAQLARQWIADNPPSELHAFLDLNFAEIQQKYGRVHGLKIRCPKLIPAAS